MLKPGKKLQLVIARGLITKWKMPIYFAVDTPMTKNLLLNIVAKMEAKGFRVWGTSFDLGNKEFLRDFEMSSGTYKVPNPCDPSRWFYLNPDVPHELKLLRNHCLDPKKKGFFFPKDPFTKRYARPGERRLDVLLETGDYIELNRSHFKSVLELDSGEFKMNWKLKPAHLNLDSAGKCSVRIAAQTMSASTAAALRVLRPECAAQAAIIDVYNDVSEYI